MLIEQNGEQVEVFTQEELDKKVNEKIEEYKLDNPTEEDIKKLQEELEKKNSELKKYEDKEYNFSELRKTKEKEEVARKILEEEKKALEAKIDEKINGVKEDIVKEKISERVKNFSNGDEELEKKILYHYNRIKDEATNDKEINKKLVDAFILATKRDDNDVVSGTISSFGSPVITKRQKNEIKPELKPVAEKLGITDEDIKKYGGQ